MKLLFRIGYNTAWGESLYLLGSVKELGEWNESKALKMTYEDGIWSTEVDIKRNVKSFEYCYIVRNDNGAVRKEWGKPHLFTFGKEIKVYEILDSWNDQPYDKSFYSSMFVNSIFHRENKNDALPHQRGGVTLEIFAPSVRPDEDLFVTAIAMCLGIGTRRTRWRLPIAIIRYGRLLSNFLKKRNRWSINSSRETDTPALNRGKGAITGCLTYRLQTKTDVLLSQA